MEKKCSKSVTVLFLVVALLLSCVVIISVLYINNREKYWDALFFPGGLERFKLPREYSFRVPEMDGLFITTSKRLPEVEGKSAPFYVIFSKDSLVNPTENQDYIKFETNSMGDIGLIFNPNKQNDIYVRASKFLDAVNAVNYNLQVLENDEFNLLFFEPQIKTYPRILKYPFIHIHIITMSHLIIVNRYLDKHSPPVQTRIDPTRSSLGR